MAGAGTGTQAAAAASSSEYTVTGDKIIKKGLQKIGVLAVGESIPPDELTDCRDTLNMMIKNMMAQPNSVLKSMKAWQRLRKSITLSGKSTYEIKPTGGDANAAVPVHMISVRLKDTDDNETPLTKMLLEEYESLTNKSDTNTPSMYLYERHDDTGYIYLDCIPSDTTDTLEITFLRTLNNIDDANDNIDFPAEYFKLLTYAFAVDVAPEYEQKITPEISAGLEMAIAMVNSFEQEDINQYFQPGIE